LSKEMVKKELKKIGLEKLLIMWREEKSAIKIDGDWLIVIARIYWIIWNPVREKKVRHKLLEKIFEHTENNSSKE
jgi:hypothetical protein